MNYKGIFFFLGIYTLVVSLFSVINIFYSIYFDFIIALNSEPSTPSWLSSLGGKPINLGLDLAGGIHFLLEVDTERYSSERLSSEGASIKRSCAFCVN